jgi:hypothetical protein
LLTLKFPSPCSHQRVLWILPCNFSLVLFVSHFSFWCCVDPAENLSTICFFSSFEFYCSPWVHDCLVRYVIHIHSNFWVLPFSYLFFILQAFMLNFMKLVYTIVRTSFSGIILIVWIIYTYSSSFKMYTHASLENLDTSVSLILKTLWNDIEINCRC